MVEEIFRTKSNCYFIIPVTDRSENTGLVYLPVCGEADRMVKVHHERLLVFWRTARDLLKNNLAISCKRKLSRQIIKKCVKKGCKQF